MSIIGASCRRLHLSFSPRRPPLPCPALPLFSFLFLQDAISRESVGAKAVGLLDDCVELALQAREERGAVAVAAAATAVTSSRDRYFQHTQGVLDALVQLHTPR